MCGIVGYVGHREAYSILINGLKRLEYRGYDSAGVALMNGHINVFKKQGKVANLEALVEGKDVSGTTGIAHTRWATHGVPSDNNSHPHQSESNSLVLVHNGIIENYASIKEVLTERGYTFKSETDTEVLVNLIESIQKAENVALDVAVKIALNQVVGAYAIAVFHKDEPNKVVVAKMGSPLVLGLGDNEFFIASDATPFLEYTKKAIYLEDGEMGVVDLEKGVTLSKISSNELVDPFVHQLKLDLASIEKSGFEHFMLKEIYEQPTSIADTYRGRLLPKQGLIKMSGFEEYRDKFLSAQRIIIVGCGTSWHAGLVGEYLFEELARVPVEVEYASEFRYRNPVINSNDIVIAVSQSGETADTLAAIKMAKKSGATIFGICNVVGSSIARESDAGAYTHAGPEIGVASTKAFTAQVTVLAMIAVQMGKEKGTIPTSKFRSLLAELEMIPSKIAKMLETDSQIKYIAESYKDLPNFLYLGRGFNFPVALEGALKLKEISYIHAEGYPAAEMKHGPIALIDENMPVVVIAPKSGQYEKIVSNIQEVKARDGKIIAIVTEGDTAISELADFTLEISDTIDEFSALLTTIPLQLLSYHIAVMRGCNVDQPRNLAKSVTVE